jgi:phosphatidate cytidylyltransferase
LRNLLIRTATGTVYVLATIGALLLGKVAFGIYFAIAMAINLFEFYRLTQKGGYKPQTVVGLAIAVYLFLSLYLVQFYQIPSNVFLALAPLLLAIPISEMWKKSSTPTLNIALTVMGLVYIVLPFATLILIVAPFNIELGEYMPKFLIALFAILWANDSGAYLVGSTLGKHKLIERISPKKTWEGAIGGAVLAAITSIVIFGQMNELNLAHAIFISLLTVVAGTLGDLFESMIKRHFNAKDSGTILPGHGGLLDRFDSLLFSAPVFFIYISFFLN